MRRRLVLTVVALALGGCTHLPWHPYAGWREWKGERVSVYTDTLSQYEPAFEWLDVAHRVYQSTFFREQPVPPAQVLYLADGVDSPFLDSRAVFKYGVTIARSPWAEAHGGHDLVVVGFAGWQAHYNHQMAHHFIASRVPGAPLWFSEGFASYLTGFKIYPDHPGVACFGLEQPSSIAKVIVPLGDLLSATFHDYNESTAPWVRPAAQGLVDYLIHGEGGSLRPRLDSLMRALAGGKDSRQALAAVYPEVTFDELDARYRAHLRALRPPGDPCPLPLPIPAITAPASTKIPMSDTDVRALFDSLEKVQDRNGYGDFYN